MLSSFLSPFSQAKFHSALCVNAANPRTTGRNASQTGERSQRTAAKPNSPAERDELRKVTQRSSARRRAVSLLTSAGGVMPKDPPQRPKKPGVKYDLTTCACLLSCSDFQQRGFYVASWTATTGSDDAALRDG